MPQSGVVVARSRTAGGRVPAGAYTITGAAEAAGVPVSTLRYYERVGYLGPTGRSSAGYRWYDAAAVERVRVLRAAQAMGLKLSVISELVELDGRDACSVVRARLEERIAAVEAEMAELKRVRGELGAALELCRTDNSCCQVLVKLTTSARIGGS